MSESEAYDLVKKISIIGQGFGFVGNNLNQNSLKNDQRKHKYDVWIAKEVKKNRNILNMTLNLRLIIDWAIHTKIDLFAYNFDEANEKQNEWHQKMMLLYEIEDIKIPQIDNKRIIFRFRDKKHFLYLLTPEDLKYEGKIMGHCVGSNNNYKTKIKNKISLILSLRDIYNEPHVTIEIDVSSAQEIQRYGKCNFDPIPKYANMLKEFVLYATNYKYLKNPETLKFLNMHFLI